MRERFKTFTLLVANISRNIRKIKSEEMREYNLKAPHVSCLYYLYKNGPLTASELGEASDEDKGAVSRSLDFLEAAGYVRRDRAGNKKYKAPLYLTESGKKIGEDVVEKIDCVLDEVGRGMSEKEREDFYRMLELIALDLRKVTEKYDTHHGGCNSE